MCIISDKIVFCTCEVNNIFRLKHCWVLYRFDKKKKMMCVGIPVIPTAFLDKEFLLNEFTMLRRLNEKDAFDKPIQFLIKDKLQIRINCGEEDNFFYTFQFWKNKWHTVDEDPFDLLNNFNEQQKGKVKSALKRIKK